jgi:hypothetical protein
MILSVIYLTRYRSGVSCPEINNLIVLDLYDFWYPNVNESNHDCNSDCDFDSSYDNVQIVDNSYILALL